MTTPWRPGTRPSCTAAARRSVRSGAKPASAASIGCQSAASVAVLSSSGGIWRLHSMRFWPALSHESYQPEGPLAHARGEEAARHVRQESVSGRDAYPASGRTDVTRANVEHELWTARSSESVEDGTGAVVRAADGAALRVAPEQPVDLEGA